MEHLPPTGWANVATKDDVEHLRVSTTHHLDQLRAQMVHEFEQRDAATEIRFERIDLRFHQVEARFDQMEQRMDQRFDNFRLALKADLERALRMQTFALIGLMFTILSAFFALQQAANR